MSTSAWGPRPGNTLGFDYDTNGGLGFDDPAQMNNASRDLKTDQGIVYNLLLAPFVGSSPDEARIPGQAPIFIFRAGAQSERDISRMVATLPMLNSLLRKAYAEADPNQLARMNLDDYARLHMETDLSRLLCPSVFEREFIWGGSLLQDAIPPAGRDVHGGHNFGVTGNRDNFVRLTDVFTENIHGHDSIQEQMEGYAVYGRWPIYDESGAQTDQWTKEPQVRIVATHRLFPPVHSYPDYRKPYARMVNGVCWRVGRILQLNLWGRSDRNARKRATGITEGQELSEQVVAAGLMQRYVLTLCNTPSRYHSLPTSFGRY